jgi:hypothetical protein
VSRDCLLSEGDPTARKIAFHVSTPSLSNSDCRCPGWAIRVDFAMSAIDPLTLQQQMCHAANDLLITSVNQVPKLKLPIMCYERSDCQWSVIKPRFPNKPRGTPRVDERRVATCDSRLAGNCRAFVKPASIRRWLRKYESTP